MDTFNREEERAGRGISGFWRNLTRRVILSSRAGRAGEILEKARLFTRGRRQTGFVPLADLTLLDVISRVVFL